MSTSIPDLIPLIDLNPLHWIGDKAKEGLADGFTPMMMSIWSGAMWLLKTAFSLIDGFTPNVADPGRQGAESVAVLSDHRKADLAEGHYQRDHQRDPHGDRVQLGQVGVGDVGGEVVDEAERCLEQPHPGRPDAHHHRGEPIGQRLLGLVAEPMEGVEVDHGHDARDLSHHDCGTASHS